MFRLLKFTKEFPKFFSSDHKILTIKLSFLKRIFPYIKAYKKEGIIASLSMIVVSLLALPAPFLLKFIIDDVIVGKNLKLLNFILLLLIGIQVAKLIFSFLTRYLFGVFNQEILLKIKKDLFHRILRLPLSFFDKNQSGYLLSRIGEVEGLSLFFSNSLVRLLIGVFEFVFSLVILFYLNWLLTLIALFILPIIFLTSRFYTRGIRKLSREVMESGAVLSRQVQDTLSGMEVVKVFTAEERETARIHNFLKDYKQANIRKTVAFTFSSELLSLIGAIGGYVVLWYSGWDIIRGNFTVGSYIAFSAYLAKLYGPTQMLSNLGLTFQPAAAALERVTELMDLSGEEERDGGVKVERLRGDIEFQGVFFSYDSKPVLRGMDLRIRVGENVLLTGPNGSGKSTIVKLILGLYKPQEGRIIIDGHDIESFSLSSLRERVSIVSQNTFLFNDTIRNNILYSWPEAKEEKVEEAAKEAGAYDFIQRLEKGFETMVGEKGKRLSGGEKQKISIGRAILKDADVLIFDEASSDLDRESERKLGEIIKGHFKDKTCIIISHKMASIPEIDRVFMIKRGKIVERNIL